MSGQTETETEVYFFELVVIEQATIHQSALCAQFMFIEMRVRFSPPLIKAAKWEITFTQSNTLFGRDIDPLPGTIAS